LSVPEATIVGQPFSSQV